VWSSGFLRCALGCASNLATLSTTFGLYTCPQSIHEIDDIRAGRLFRPLDLLAFRLLLDQCLERAFVLVLERLGVEVGALRIDDVQGKIEHVLWDFLVFDIRKILRWFAHLVWIAKRDAQHALVARFEGDDGAEVRYLPQSLMSDVPRIVAGLRVGQSFAAIPVPQPPVIRKGASGTFYDKGLEGASHHAVIPNVNTIDKLREVWPRLSSDGKKLFDVIARAYLAALMPDFRYRHTTATLDVRGFEFRASGRQPIDLGWRAAFPDWRKWLTILRATSMTHNDLCLATFLKEVVSHGAGPTSSAGSRLLLALR